MKDKFMSFLESNNLFPIEKYWNTFDITHKKPDDETERQRIRTYIDNQVGRKDGIYAYRSPGGSWLYVGKAKPLRSRLLSHYRESYETVPGDTKDNRWHHFFLEHSGDLSVYWVEIEEEQSRKIVEMMIDFIIEPTFNEWK